jgi:hypothetical protein
MIHLHWAWDKGPSAARGVTIGMALCGARVPTDTGELTSFREDATCPKCLARLERGDTTVPDGIGPAPPKRDKTRTAMLRRAAKKGDLK